MKVNSEKEWRNVCIRLPIILYNAIVKEAKAQGLLISDIIRPILREKFKLVQKPSAVMRANPWSYSKQRNKPYRCEICKGYYCVNPETISNHLIVKHGIDESIKAIREG